MEESISVVKLRLTKYFCFTVRKHFHVSFEWSSRLKSLLLQSYFQRQSCLLWDRPHDALKAQLKAFGGWKHKVTFIEIKSCIERLMPTVKDLNYPEKDKEVKNHLKLHKRELAIVNVLVNSLLNISFTHSHRILHIF